LRMAYQSAATMLPEAVMVSPMNESSAPRFATELRISPRPLIGLLLVPAVALVLLAWNLPDPSSALNLALLLYALAGATGILVIWKPWLGRWVTIITLVAAVQLVHSWLGVPGFLALMAIPTALAAAMVGLPAATATTIAETALLLLGPHISSSETLVALIATWAALGMMYLVHRPIHQLARWSWEHFQRASDLLEQARDRQAELKEALDALAHANRQLTLTNEKLAAMRLVAEEAQKTKAAFVANVSHEFRTPLNMIIGLTDLLTETPEVYGERLHPELLQDLEIVHRNCEHLASMVNDVLHLSQLEAGRLALHREHIDLADIIDGALAVVRPLLNKKGLRLRVAVPDDLEEVYCDQTRIRQVILNLISNAVRFTEAGNIAVRAAQEGQWVVVSVSDTGPGISPDDAERIFEPFQQATKKLWRSQNGSGLGLSISKQFVELHGGRMWLESRVGVGSTFSFKLPISPLIEPTGPPGRWISEGWVQRKSRRVDVPTARLEQRVILCDETGELWPLFSRYDDSAEFVDTRNLAQTTGELQRCPAQAVVLNAGSPDELWSLVEQARLRMPDVPIIGCSLPPRAGRALTSGAIDYLLKPLTRSALQGALEAVDRPVRRVLVVDDEEDALRLLARMLRACDGTLEIATASSGPQALEELRSSPPDLVLLDILMPDMDGWLVLAAKNREEAIRDIPVVIISAQDPQDQPLTSRAVVATMGEGLSISKLLRYSRQVSALLLQPD